MAEQRSPAYGSSKPPETQTGPWFGKNPVPAEGSDVPFPDYTDWGLLESPAEGSQEPSPAGSPVVPQRLGRARGPMGRLSILANKGREEVERQRVIGENVNTLHTLAGQAGNQFSDRGYLDAGRDALRQLSESGGIIIHEDGSISSADIGEENDEALKQVLEQMRDRWQASALLGKKKSSEYPGPVRIIREK